MAESFGADAERYDRTRPPYPDALVERIVATSPGLAFLNVGCGTGIEARQFQAAGCTVLGVEPDERMAEFARARGLPVETATFEAWEPADRTFDAVIAGTAWHWVDPIAGAAKAAKVLRPGGRLAPFHHVFQTPPEVMDAIIEVCRHAAPETAARFASIATRPTIDAYQLLFAKIADGIREADGFGEPEQWSYAWERTYTRDEWVDQLPTFGGLTQLPADAMKQVQEGVAVAIDAIGGSLTMPYTTIAVTAVRSTAT
jgi:SAM-dependent methyltransferase